MTELMATVGDLELCYETFGDEGDPAVLLIMGLSTQMHGWNDDFCTQLADRGFHVIRFDNRDIGRSTRLTAFRPPTLRQILLRDKRAARYGLDDMADDAIGLLDALGIERVHAVGASMGGMIAQVLAIRHPDRLLSLVSIMSNTGGRRYGQPALRILPLFLRGAPRSREAYVERTVKTFRAIGSRGFDFDEAQVRRTAERSYDRGVDAAGPGRQLAAILAARDRSAELRDVRVPALIVHGSADPMVNPSGGRRTASSIPDARLLVIEGMGHDLPRGAWPQIIDAIAENAARAVAA
jgi:pimeloyl-ACP methyl ester carboxylesterase